MDKKAGVGELSCKVCGQQFQTGINCEMYWHNLVLLSLITRKDLSAAVDVYSDWIDACDIVAKDDDEGQAPNDGLNSYGELAVGNERRNSEMNVDRHLVTAVGGNEYGGDSIDDD